MDSEATKSWKLALQQCETLAKAAEHVRASGCLFHELKKERTAAVQAAGKKEIAAIRAKGYQESDLLHEQLLAKCKDPSKATFVQSIWLFNLGYYLLANMAQVMTFFIIGKESGGLFGSAQYLVLALQMFLHYFGILMAPRLIVWHKANLAMFRRRVLLIAGGASTGGVVAFGVLWAITDWLYPLLFGEAFASAAGLLPWLVLGKFFAVGTAMFTWGLWAEHRDNLPVLCCLPCCVISGALYFVLLPKYGNAASAWLTLGAETALLIASATAFTLAVRRP